MADKENTVRVRFAPSPTGNLHIGNLRVAIFNWLFARHNGGKYLLRIEDTDTERSSVEYVNSIKEILDWFGLNSDEPPVFQSARIKYYQECIDKLLKNKNIYWSDPKKEDNGKSVLRFKVPKEKKTISFNDLIRGEITVDLDLIDDFVIARSDGSPLYNFVVVADDIDMGITHIIRGEDHISNSTKQIMIYNALEANVPKFAHLPMILGESGGCLSKRDASVNLFDYRENGFLSDAILNYLVRLGWAHGDQEIFTREELIKLFSLKNVSKSGAVFDCKKLNWLNSVYIKNSDPAYLIEEIDKYVENDFSKKFTDWSKEQLLGFVKLYSERVSNLQELINEITPLHATPVYKALPDDTGWNTETGKLLEKLEHILNLSDKFSADDIKTIVKEFCKKEDVKLPAVAKPIRFALTSGMQSPSVFKMVELFGKTESLKRIEKLRKFLLQSS